MGDVDDMKNRMGFILVAARQALRNHLTSFQIDGYRFLISQNYFRSP